MSNPQIHQHSNPTKFNTDTFLLPSGSSIRGGRESGQALFVLLALIIAAVIGLVFGFFRPTALAIENDNKTWQALAQAKDVLIGYAVSHPLKPGLLPYSDRNADGDFNGYSDCPPQDSNPVTNSLLLGEFPVIGELAPCVSPRVLGMDKVDGNGERLWFAVSSNLVDDRIPGSTPNIPGNLNGTGNWLTIRDANGTVIDSTVAFVVLSPSQVLPGQNRSGPAPAAANFLDNFTVSGTTYSNWDVSLGFVSAEDTAKVPAGANQFNDRLLYVTRDQYRLAIAKRVIGEVKNQIKLFSPYPSPTADPAGQCLAPPPPPPPPPSYLPIDPVTCGSNALTGLPSWFTSEWESYVQYTPTGPNTAVLTIFGNNFAVP
ncbi:MAG: hypothetical protein ACREUJ_01300 [Burkholderiales bacterium]